MSRQSDPGFWTSCPSCCHVHQYSRDFLNRKLRCPSCRRPFAAVELSSPPPIVPGTDMYYCTWGFYPLGFPEGTSPPANWTPVMPSNNNPPSSHAQPPPANPTFTKTTARKKVVVSKRGFGSGGIWGGQDEGVFRGIDVNEEARISDLFGDDTGGDNHTEGIGFNIDVDVGATGDDVFRIW